MHLLLQGVVVVMTFILCVVHLHFYVLCGLVVLLAVTNAWIVQSELSIFLSLRFLPFEF